MIYLAFIFLILLGLASGILINVLADDLPHYVTPSQPHCHQCGRTYPPRQWLAGLALFTGQGRCGQCDARIRWRKLLVEAASAILLVFLFQRFEFTPKFIFLSLFLECLLLITVIDLEHRLILYATIFPAGLAALLYGLFGSGGDLWPALVRSLIGGAAAFGVFYVFYLLGFVYSAWVARRRGQPLDEIAFGGGDVNLAAVVGLAVGWPAIVLSLVYTVLAGGAISAIFLAVMFLRRRNALLEPLPYGPFIVLGALVVLVFGAELRRIYGITP